MYINIECDNGGSECTNLNYIYAAQLECRFSGSECNYSLLFFFMYICHVLVHTQRKIKQSIQ